MLGLGFQEILVLFLIALLLFGSTKLPGIGKSLGKSIREFKKAVSSEEEKDDDTDKEQKI
ncbi:MAG: twin-arginine translocase TatA/TatE family subunit [Elusimicrobia bacterium]|nr:twin-arginine translocase TatA/TatE family subunit [Candidatus Liberimonas magnetica]